MYLYASKNSTFRVFLTQVILKDVFLKDKEV